MPGPQEYNALVDETGRPIIRAEDSAHTSGQKGFMLLAVRQDTAAALAGTSGDYIPLIVDASGRIHISTAPANDGVDIGNVDVASIVPGTGATSLGKAEDAVHASGDTGVMLLAVRQDSAAALAGTSGDYIPIIVDASGRVHIAPAPANSGVDIGDVDVTSVTPGTGATNLGKAVDAIAGATDTGVATIAVRDDALGALTPIEGDYVTLRVDANGALWTHDDALDAALSGSELQVDIVASLPTGANAIGKLAANSGIDIGDVDVTSVIPGTGATNSGKAVDSIAGATDTGAAALAVRDDALGALTPIEGDYVNLRTDANGALWTHDDALDAALSGSELQVDVVAALPVGDNNIGNVDVVSLPAGNLGQQAMAASLSVVPANNVTDATYIGDIKFGEGLPANSGVDIGDVDVTSVIPGTGATNLGKAIDSVTGATDTGVAPLAVRDDALGALTPIEGDYVPLRTDANGALWTHDDALDAALSGSEIQVDIVAALPTGANAIGKLAANTGVDIGDVDVTSVIPGTGATNLGKAVDGVAGATDTGVAPLAVRDDTLSALTPIEGDYVPLRTDANGALWTHDDALDAALSGSEIQVDVVAALPAGTAIVGKVGIDQTTAGTTNKVYLSLDEPTSANPANLSAYMDNADAATAGRGNPSGFLNRLYNGTSVDRMRSIAASGAGLGVQQVGTLGELITLAASAARTSGANGTAVTGLGWRNRYIILCDITVSATDAADTLDVYIDVSLDGNTWLNAVHFTQQAGNGAARKEFAVLDPSAPGTAVINVTTDAAAAVVRPSMFGPQMRARWAIVDSGDANQSHTFSVVAYGI